MTFQSCIKSLIKLESTRKNNFTKTVYNKTNKNIHETKISPFVKNKVTLRTQANPEDKNFRQHFCTLHQ